VGAVRGMGLEVWGLTSGWRPVSLCGEVVVLDI
jgi:hypothetical protein